MMRAIFALLLIFFCLYIVVLLIAFVGALVSPGSVQGFIAATGGRYCWRYASFAAYMVTMTADLALSMVGAVSVTILAFRQARYALATILTLAFGLLIVSIQYIDGCH